MVVSIGFVVVVVVVIGTLVVVITTTGFEEATVVSGPVVTRVAVANLS